MVISLSLLVDIVNMRSFGNFAHLTEPNANLVDKFICVEARHNKYRPKSLLGPGFPSLHPCPGNTAAPGWTMLYFFFMLVMHRVRISIILISDKRKQISLILLAPLAV